MKTKFFTLLLAVAASIGTMLADPVQIGDLYYNLDATNQTAEVTSSSGNYSGEIIIPASVTYNSVTYSVTSIGEGAFWYCSGLTSVTIGNSVTSIGQLAFYNCSGLTSVTIGSSVTSIGDVAFAGCSGLTSVIWNAKNCADFALNNTPFYWEGGYGYDLRNQITSFVFGDEVKCIPAYLCAGMSQLSNITIPNSVTSIRNYAFYGCTGLTSIEIPNSVTAIGGYAFAGCRLTSVTIPNSVEGVGEFSFSCSSLKEVTINSNGVAASRHSASSSYAYYNMYRYFGFQVETYHFGDDVTCIGKNAFSVPSYYSEEVRLTSVTIGRGITSIEENAFYGCATLQKIYNHGQFPANVYSTAFDGVNKFSCTLYVPQNSIDMYKNAAVWRDFYYIEPLESVEAIEDVVDNNEATEEKTKILRDGQIFILRGDKIYTLQGAEVK